MLTTEKLKFISETMTSGMNQVNLPHKWPRMITRKRKKKLKIYRHLLIASVRMHQNQNKRHHVRNYSTALHSKILNLHHVNTRTFTFHQNEKLKIIYFVKWN